MTNKEYYDSVDSAIDTVKERIIISKKAMADAINKHEIEDSKNYLWKLMESIDLYEMSLEKLRKEV